MVPRAFVFFVEKFMFFMNKGLERICSRYLKEHTIQVQIIDRMIYFGSLLKTTRLNKYCYNHFRNIVKAILFQYKIEPLEYYFSQNSYS